MKMKGGWQSMEDYLQADKDHHKVSQCSSSADRVAENSFPLSKFKIQMQDYKQGKSVFCLCAIANLMDECHERNVADKAWVGCQVVRNLNAGVLGEHHLTLWTLASARSCDT